MKTPRQIILDRHRAVESQLATVRRAALNAVFSAPAAAPDRQPDSTRWTLRAVVLVLWRELILPARRTWIGLATVWVAILVLHFAAHDDAMSALAQSTASPPRPAILSPEQQSLWTELAGGPDLIRVAPAKSAAPKPRSEWRARHGAG